MSLLPALPHIEAFQISVRSTEPTRPGQKEACMFQLAAAGDTAPVSYLDASPSLLRRATTPRNWHNNKSQHYRGAADGPRLSDQQPAALED